MQLTNSLLATGAILATGASAIGNEVRFVETLQRSIVVVAKPAAADAIKRDDDSCTSLANSFTKMLANDPVPTPDAKLLSDLASYEASNSIPSPTDACAEVSITGSVGSEVTSYSSEVMSWWSANSADFQTLYSACSDVDGFSALVSQAAMGCTSLIADVTGTSSDSSSDEGSDDPDSGASPRQTGAVMAAVAAAGLVAAVL